MITPTLLATAKPIQVDSLAHLGEILSHRPDHRINKMVSCFRKTGELGIKVMCSETIRGKMAEYILMQSDIVDGRGSLRSVHSPRHLRGRDDDEALPSYLRPVAAKSLPDGQARR